MTAPTAPTLSSLVEEGLAKAGNSSPSTSLTERAEDQWMQEIKNDVWNGQKKLKSLQVMSLAILTIGKSRYSNPTDYACELSLKLLDGGLTGMASAGSVSTITLASGAIATVGKEIVITSGTGSGGVSQITAFDSGTRVATVSPDFGTAPDNTSVYMQVDIEHPVRPGPVWDFDQSVIPTVSRKPCEFYPLGDSDYGEFIFDSVPDKAYPVKMRYYANLMTLDLAGTPMATLYSKWRNLWVTGVKAKALDDNDDTRGPKALIEYQAELRSVIAAETYGIELSNLQTKLGE